MKQNYSFKSFISIILSIIIAFTFVPLSADSIQDITISNAEHKQTIEQFISEIKSIQRQVFDIAQAALRDPIPGDTQLEIRINLINNNIERLNRMLQDYLATVPDVSDQNRHVLLTFNVLNLAKNSLYSLSLLIRETSDIERLALLDEYFRSRVTSLDTLAILEAILERFDT
ncbi:hypothetical protein [Cellulosilyticum sp. I15G10I2]|uniref:hypothetical protein n=1 Tax=Cellulosilyticum sp. I15G10I2 TaxID=1892843 RepID=UPI00085BF085|nr:hypothetical protein [Cellulosilyticum sp. I15G10I2]